MAESLSRFPIKIKVLDLGEASGELNRLTAPLTVGELMKRLPITGRIMPGHGCVSILLGLKRGAEKPVTNVDAGVIAYWPQQGSLCIYPVASKTSSPVNKVGIILNNVDIFKGLKTGSRVVIEKG
jgi:hypothetical protein